MRKLSFILGLLVVLGLTACSSSEGTSDSPKEEKAKADEKSVEVDKGLFNVEVTLPASMFEGDDPEKVIADAKADGVSEVEKNPDGSFTYKMSKAKHKEMMKELEKGIVESLEEMKTSGDFASIKDITHNDSFKEFTLVVDKAAYENSMDGFSIFGLGISGMMYQLYSGESEKDVKVTISVKDQTSQEVFETVVYPDDMEDTEDTEN